MRVTFDLNAAGIQMTVNGVPWPLRLSRLQLLQLANAIRNAGNLPPDQVARANVDTTVDRRPVKPES